MRPCIALLAIVLVVAEAAAVAGCGAGASPVEPARAALAPPAQGHPLSVAQLRVQLADGARAALRQVAAMSQPGDDAATSVSGCPSVSSATSPAPRLPADPPAAGCAGPRPAARPGRPPTPYCSRTAAVFARQSGHPLQRSTTRRFARTQSTRSTS
jgi:hypothetical protein